MRGKLKSVHSGNGNVFKMKAASQSDCVDYTLNRVLGRISIAMWLYESTRHSKVNRSHFRSQDQRQPGVFTHAYVTEFPLDRVGYSVI
jgi:hypothetical protein